MWPSAERAVLLDFHLCCFYFIAVLVVRVSFPFGVWRRLWNSNVSVPDHWLFYQLTVTYMTHNLNTNRTLKDLKYSAGLEM